MPEPIPLFPRPRRRQTAVAVAAGVASVVALVLAIENPEPAYPGWAEVTKTLESEAWPLVRAARYDPVNHFVLIDVKSGVAPHVIARLACEEIRPLVDGIDPTAGFALYEAPDRLIAHRDDCST
jgi:hypothetical protein